MGQTLMDTPRTVSAIKDEIANAKPGADLAALFAELKAAEDLVDWHGQLPLPPQRRN